MGHNPAQIKNKYKRRLLYASSDYHTRNQYDLFQYYPSIYAYVDILNFAVCTTMLFSFVLRYTARCFDRFIHIFWQYV